MASPLAIAIPALGVLGYLMLSGKSKAAAPASGAAPAPAGKPVAQRMAEVIATGDPALIRAEAAKLRKEGYPEAAAELDRVAGLIAKPATPAQSQIVKPPAPAPAPAPTASSSTLRRTSPVLYDARVVPVQQRLIALGWALKADGKFGPDTESAVKAFQTLNGVKPVDGVVGPVTALALASPSAKGPRLVAAPAPVVRPAPVKPPAPAPVQPATPVLPAGPPPSSGATAPTITPLLRSLPSLLRNGKPTYKAPASSGQAVKDWQTVLVQLGFLKAPPDGKFGDATEVATRAFQAAANSAAAKSGKAKLTVDGIVGPATVARAAAARVVPSGPASFTGDGWFGGDVMMAPSSPRPDSPLPGLMPPMAPTPPSPRRALAARLTHMLFSVGRGGEDRTLVALYQQQEGLKPTGYYGPATALSLARTYGIVPPKPLHWTESRTSKSKANYRDALRMLGERDPQRSEEWIRAGEV